MTICDAIDQRRLIQFTYDGHPRVVIPACYGVTTKGNRALRAFQIEGSGTSDTEPPYWRLFTEDGMQGVVVLERTFAEVPPDYNPNDAHLDVICCL